MSQQFDPYNQQVPPTEYASANPYGQPAENPYAQPEPVANPYGQPAENFYAAPQYAPMPPLDRGRGMALAGLILGIIGIIAWLIPLFGFPVTIVGIVLAALGRRSTSRRGMALAGLILSIVGLVLSFGNCALGIYLATPH